MSRFRRRLMTVKANSLPYTPVDYIETDGTAYIETDIIGNSPMSFKGKMLPIATSTGEYSYFMGCRKDSGTRFWPFLIYGPYSRGGFGYGDFSDTNMNINNSVNNRTPLEFHTILHNGTCLLGIKQQGASTFTERTRWSSLTVSTGYNICIFAAHNNSNFEHSKSGTRCYWVKIYSDNNYTNIAFDGVPCYYNGEYGLWDNVTDSFFGNAAGSGSFTGPAI